MSFVRTRRKPLVFPARVVGLGTARVLGATRAVGTGYMDQPASLADSNRSPCRFRSATMVCWVGHV